MDWSWRPKASPEASYTPFLITLPLLSAWISASSHLWGYLKELLAKTVQFCSMNGKEFLQHFTCSRSELCFYTSLKAFSSSLWAERNSFNGTQEQILILYPSKGVQLSLTSSSFNQPPREETELANFSAACKLPWWLPHWLSGEAGGEDCKLQPHGYRVLTTGCKCEQVAKYPDRHHVTTFVMVQYFAILSEWLQFWTEKSRTTCNIL